MKLWKRDKSRQTNLQRFMSEAEQLILDLPEAQQREALEAVNALLGSLGPLFALPEGVWTRLWKALTLIMAKTVAGAKVEALLVEASEGAPRLLERARTWPAVADLKSRLEAG